MYKRQLHQPAGGDRQAARPGHAAVAEVQEVMKIDAKTQLFGEIGGLAAKICLLYTSDAADERSSVDLGGRRII